MSKSQTIMYLVNFVLLVFGIALTAVAGLAVTNHKALLNDLKIDGDSVNDTAVLNNGPIVALVTGIALMLIGLLGCCSAKKYEKGWAKCVLMLYSLMALSVFALSVAAGAIQLTLSGKLRDFSGPDASDAEKLDHTLYQQMETFSNKTFTACCANGAPHVGNNEACKLIQKGVLEKEGVCATPASFQPVFFQFLSDTLHPLGIVSLVVAIVTFFVVIASCCLLWRSRKDEAEQKRRLVDEEAGGQYYRQDAAAPPQAQRGAVRYT